MANTQNGWSIDPPRSARTVTDGGKRMVLRNGDPGDVLAEFVRRFDKLVENVDQGADDWSFALRYIGGTRVWSEHAAGTACDLNATKHVQGKRGTFTKAQVTQIRRLQGAFGGVVEWGGDWSNVDEMHFQLIGNARRVSEIALMIRNAGHQPAPPAPPTGRPTLRRGSTGAEVSKLQEFLNKVYPAYSNLQVDGVFGAKTEGVVREFQRRAKLAVDGIVGPNTWRALGF